MKRRAFIGGIAAASAGLIASPLRAKPSSALRLTLLHTNDVHSHLEPKSGGTHAGLGGAPARAAVIKQLRREHPHVLLLDSGDILQGTPYFNLFQGKPEMEAMNAMGYMASTVGNHEFDPGIERLAELARDVMKFPFLCCNYDFGDTPMAGLTREWIYADYDGLRVGLFGVGIKLEGLVSARAYGSTRYLNPLESARKTARTLRDDLKCDFVICLSHVSYRGYSGEPGDQDLVREIPEIDVILGGHNHIFVNAERFDRASAGGFVNQCGWAGTHLGILQFDVSAREKRELVDSGAFAIA